MEKGQEEREGWLGLEKGVESGGQDAWGEVGEGEGRIVGGKVIGKI